MCESHSCAWTWRVMAIFAGLGSCLHVRVSVGSSFEDTSWAISARVLTFNVPVLLMTMGMILTFAFSMPWVWRAYLSGS